MTEALEHRTRVYVQRPAQFSIAGCKCGNNDPDWSEYKHHLWCATCEIDFKPEHNGIFDGPIPVYTCALLGISFDEIDLATQTVIPFKVEELSPTS